MLLPECLGFTLVPVALPEAIQGHVRARDWPALDQAMRPATSPGGVIFEALMRYERFDSIEFIISIRSSLAEPDDDGIWHDDGSRVLAFSLSLTEDPGAIEGGRLGLRRRGRGEGVMIPTPPFGTMIVFATGVSGFEHCIHRVAAGERIIVAGWCTCAPARRRPRGASPRSTSRSATSATSSAAFAPRSCGRAG